MPVTQPMPIAERGKQDARRHREKQRRAIKENLPEIIADESIITRRKGKTVRVPIRSIRIPHFRPGTKGVQSVGVGQGPGKPGDVIGRRPGQGKQPGKPGDQPGEDYIETEIDIEELIEIMLEDLGLPNLKQKEVAELEVILGIRITGLRRSGPWVLLDRVETAKEGIRRFWFFLRILQREALQILQEKSGRDEAVCAAAMRQAGGCFAGALKILQDVDKPIMAEPDSEAILFFKPFEVFCTEALRKAEGHFNEAIQLLQDPDFGTTEIEVKPFPVFHQEDLRFRNIKENIAYESNAVVLAMMDTSGSMSQMKKYLARSFFFWLVEFLRKLYKKVEIRFIAQTTESKLVDEDTFFHKGESGGTYCFTAYELAGHLVDTEYPTNRWNVYPFHFSDGEDFNPHRTVEEVKKLLAKGVNMLGYGEIRTGGFSGASTLLPRLKEALPVEVKKAQGTEIIVGNINTPFLAVTIQDKKHIWLALQEFLRKERW